METKNIVLLDDNYVIREVVKKTLKNYRVYTTDNGVEGLGYIYLSKPDIVIVDTTLPKYGGLEVIEYLTTNQTLRNNNTQIIVIHQGKEKPQIEYPSISYVSKSEDNFLEKLQERIGVSSIIKSSLGNKLVRLSNKSDEIQFKVKQNRLPWINWFLVQVHLSLILTAYTIQTGRKTSDENLPQQEKDSRAFRVRYYPTLATAVAAFLFLFLQVGLFVSGGIIIFNTKITSIFAASPEVVVDLNNSEFDSSKIENMSGILQLKPVTSEGDVSQIEEPVSFPEEIRPEIEPQSTVSYSSEHPAIIFLDGIDYTNIESILEESSINNSESSKSEALVNNGTSITYQLSPNKENWYYYGTQGWEETTQGHLSSNTIQDINENISTYTSLMGEGTLFIRAYLNSEGNNNVTLTNLKVLREYDIPEELPEVPVSLPVTLPEGTLPTPVIYQASFHNGDKVVYGKVLNLNEDENLEDYRVKVYYTSSTDLTQPASEKLDLIGEANLEKSENNEVTFLLRTPSTDGGYVTAQLVTLSSSKSEESALSRPMENSTFTVDSTGDGADASAGNGVCATSGAVCTLRAAIGEANALSGSDNIHFNIPTSDSGYRDYDTPDTSSSGDSLGGDDYWTIRPATALPTISESITIDGGTQETNQGDENTFGPDIQIIRGAAYASSGLTLTGTNNTINKLIVARFTQADILIQGNNTTVTNSYISFDPKSIEKDTATTLGGVRISASNVSIGTTVSDGNALAGGTRGAIDIFCTANHTGISIRGNRLNMSYDTNSMPTVLPEYGVTIDSSNLTNECGMEIGGDSPTHRNYLAASYAIINVTKDNIINLGIYNNFFGTDITGTQQRSRNDQYESVMTAIGILFTWDRPGSTVRIGAPNKGNLFRYLLSPIYVGLGGITIQNNTIADIVGYDDTLERGQGIHVEGFTPENITTDGVRIYNNFIGKSESDPYFGLNVGSDPISEYYGSSSDGITGYDAIYEIKGNIISGLSGIPIHLSSTLAYYYTREDDTTNPFPPVIGGTESFANSLCNGKSQNCIHGNDYAGIITLDALPLNEETLLEDNDFAGGNGENGQNNIEVTWSGLFEVFSSNYRRTDLSELTLTLPENGRVREGFSPLSPNDLVSSLTAVPVFCSNNDLECPASGHTVGTAGTTLVSLPYWLLQYGIDYYPYIFQESNYFWLKVTEYVIDGSGNKIDYSAFKFDDAHFSSETFTFDGNSTNNIINTGSERTLNDQTYTDRGEPWTDYPLATRDPSTGESGKFQIMEVEYVDANPVEQEDGSYIITVDSTEDVSVHASNRVFFNDGNGTASGGISKLDTSVLANGSTSLREAVEVANTFPSPERVEFNIPTSDTNYNTIDFPNRFNIVLNSYMDSLTSEGVILDGSTQDEFTGDQHPANYDQSNPNNITNGPEIVLNFNDTIDRWAMNALNGTIKNIGFYNSKSDDRIFEVTNTGAIVEENDFIGGQFGAMLVYNSANCDVSITKNVFKQVSDAPAIEESCSKGGIRSLNSNYFVNTDSAVAFVTNNSQLTGTVTADNNFFYGTTDYSIGVHTNNELWIRDNIFRNTEGNNVQITNYQTPEKIKITENISSGGTALSIDISDQEWSPDGVNINDAGDSDTGPNNLMNYPEIEQVIYLSGGKYRINGILDNNVSGEGPFDIEICLSDNHSSGHGGCTESLGYFENAIPQVAGGINPFSVEVTVAGDNGTQDNMFTSLATNNLGSTSEFSENFNTENNPNYSLALYPIPILYPTGTIDDPKPLIDWNINGDSDLAKYEIYLDGNKIGETTPNITQFQYTGDNLAGEHTLRIVGIRTNQTTSGETTVIFKVEPATALEIVYPKGVIDTKIPLIDWNVDSATNVNHYEIYLDGEFYQAVPTETQYQVVKELEEKEYTLQIVAFYEGVDSNGEEVYQEIGRTNTETFSVQTSTPIQPQTNPENPPLSYPEPISGSILEAIQAYPLVTIFLLLLGVGILTAGVIAFRRRNT